MTGNAEAVFLPGALAALIALAMDFLIQRRSAQA
jgi:hypothetical protein